MSNIDADALLKGMLSAAKAAVTGHWNDLRPFAEAEMKKLVTTALQIEAGRVDGSLSEAQARILLKMQANSSQAVLTAVETVGMIAAQDAINAALGVVKDAVNTAVGVVLL